MNSDANLLELRGVSVPLGACEVVSDVNLTVRPGEVVALVGANGAGKTTLLRAALGLVDFRGELRWNGKHHLVRDRAAMSKLAGYVPQSPTELGELSVWDSIAIGLESAFGLSREQVSRVEEAARLMDVEALLDRAMATLSGGQKQRVYLARALVRRPAMLVLDEPATFLDVRHQVELHERLTKLSRDRGTSVLMASHDLNLASTHADRIVLMKAGRIMADDTPERVLTEQRVSEAFGVDLMRVELNGETILVPKRRP
jgi:iron complex transport system ATP-binding protein